MLLCWLIYEISMFVGLYTTQQDSTLKYWLKFSPRHSFSVRDPVGTQVYVSVHYKATYVFWNGIFSAARAAVHCSPLPLTYHSWFRHYATSRKVAGWIPDEVIGFLNWRNPSSRTMALGSTQSLTETSIRNIPGDKRRPARLTISPLCADCLGNVGASTSHSPMDLRDLLQGQIYPFVLPFYYVLNCKAVT
jgi:hypothetical protein